jgi:hypothetical protein
MQRSSTRAGCRTLNIRIAVRSVSDNEEDAMSDEITPHVSVMEGGGAYGTHSSIPAAGGGTAIPYLEAAAERIAVEGSGRPIVIADYGCSDGKNALAPMRVAIAALRRRIGPSRPVLVYHNDLPGNDFTTLFRLLDSDPTSYVRNDAAVYSYAIGRSFYQSVIPPAVVDLAWSSFAAVWLSQVPRQIPGHFCIPFSTGAIRAEFEEQAARDWERFLALRALELRSGGRLVIALPALDDESSMELGGVMEQANATLAELAKVGEITTDERRRMTIAACPRRERDLVAPFAKDGQFNGLIVEDVNTAVSPDPAWSDYERDRNADALAARRALFFRVIFVPSLAQSLTPTRTAEERRVFADRLEAGLRQRLASTPAPMNLPVSTIVLMKRAAA